MAKLAKTKVVTGYVPLPDHPRSQQEYEKLAYKLSDALGDHPLEAFLADTVKTCWMTEFLEKLPPMEPPLKWSKGDDPRKNSLEYHVVQHQKFEWLSRAAAKDSEPDTFIWMDIGICHQPGIGAEVIRPFLARVRKNDWAFPGCWPPNSEPIDQYPSWRFLGSLLIVPRNDIPRLLSVVKAMARLYTRMMKNVTWEVNTLARAESYFLKASTFRWYEADHNATQFTRYE